MKYLKKYKNVNLFEKENWDETNFDLEEFEEIEYVFASWMYDFNYIYILVKPDFNKNNVTIFNDYIVTDIDWATKLIPLSSSKLNELKNDNTNKIIVYGKQTVFRTNYSELIKMYPKKNFGTISSEKKYESIFNEWDFEEYDSERDNVIFFIKNFLKRGNRWGNPYQINLTETDSTISFHNLNDIGIIHLIDVLYTDSVNITVYGGYKKEYDLGNYFLKYDQLKTNYLIEIQNFLKNF